ncbi:Clp protease ClpP [Lachnospiraceae bacterium Marseille-Q4251]|nr:Clp protease ClpP [Lachnospiraceae bacterium Marseille-Q4251]
MKMQFKNKGKLAGSLEIKNQTQTSADLNIFGDIVSDEWGKWSDEDTCPSDISDFLKNLDGAEEINLHINSGGGSVFGGIAIYNMLKRSKAKVTTYIDGIAASIASVVACAGDRIIIPANGTFMIHKPTNGYFLESLNADDLRKDAEILDTCQKAILQAYMEHTKEGVSEDAVNDLINAETWMVGKDVTDYFNFEVENSVNATACQSDLFDRYKHTPEDLKRKTPDDIADEVMRRLKDEKEQERKKALLEDLDFFGV